MPEEKVLESEVLVPTEPSQTGLTQEELVELFFRKVNLSDEQEQLVVADLDKCVKDAFESRNDLDDMLARWNDMAEGIATPKNFPWPNSSNLFIPVTEVHMNNVHSAARQTLLKGESLYYVRSVGGMETDFDTAAKLERFMGYKANVELPLIDRFSQLIWCAERDGTVIAQIQWQVKKGKVREIAVYTSTVQFLEQHPTPEDAGLSQKQYNNVVEKLKVGNRVVLVEATERVLEKGPVISIVQLADFLMSPMSSIRTEFAKFVGKVFTMNKDQLNRAKKFDDWDNVDDVISTKEDGRKDMSTQLKDDIEGIVRRSGKGEFVLVDGIHHFDLDDDGVDEKYLAVYHPLSKKLLMYLHYPYLHDKDCFVALRLKKRPNRFLGRGLPQMLEDINFEINTQHNQRIDSRTITTVPTFKAKATAKTKFDPTRADQRFIPGRVFYLDNFDDVAQFDIRPTDMGESLQEESTLMSMADQQTGSGQLRSGQETKQDPRAPAAKVSMLLNQSNVRLDDYFEELAGSAPDNEGFNAIGEQILELYYQFFDDDMAKLPMLKPNLQPELDDNNKPKTVTMKREDFLLRNRMKVQMAKISTLHNPDAMLMRYMQLFSLLINDPLVGQRPEGRMNLIKTLLTLSREENTDKYLPKDVNEASQAMGVAQIMAMMQKGGGPGGSQAGARNRNGALKPATPAAGGSTRPNG